MYEKIMFINHLNQKIEFGNKEIFANMNNLRDYDWEYTVVGNSITIFSKKATKKTIPIIVFANEENTAEKFKDMLFEKMEMDVLANKPGRIYIGDSYLEGFVVGTSKQNYLIDKRYIELTVDFATTSPFWIKENTHIFKSSDILSTNNKTYPYKYGYRYANGLANTSITNNHYADCHFKLVIYGKCINPTIIIGANIYKVHTLIEQGERLEIDSKNKTVVKVRNSGYIENLFNSRDKENDVFKKIKMGLNSVNWNGSFDFDVILYEERSEPKWI